MGVVVVLGRWRAFSVVVAVGLVVGAVVGCSSSVKPSGSTAAPTASASLSPDPSASAAAVQAAVLDVYHRYWDATVAAQRGNPDPALFADNTKGALVEQELADAKQYVSLGIVREGAPTFSSVTVEADGDQATVLACVDNSKWVVPEATGEPLGVLPTGLSLERIAGAWFVTKYVDPPASFTC